VGATHATDKKAQTTKFKQKKPEKTKELKKPAEPRRGTRGMNEKKLVRQDSRQRTNERPKI
jgi:hypothetical protein